MQGYDVKILADSISNGHRLTTFECRYPRFVHAQMMTHRLFSRNAGSSRAIPTKKLIRQIRENPVMPLHWGKNQSGMQAHEEVDEHTKKMAEDAWKRQMFRAISSAEYMLGMGVHKQIVNRMLEPWMFITVIISATEFENFYRLRGADAQPEIAWVASEMKRLQGAGKPKHLIRGQWHLPFIRDDEIELPIEVLLKLATARCARVSYLTHDGVRDVAKDIELHDRLAESGHWSPFEHVATPMVQSTVDCGNFRGWEQYRKYFKNEACPDE